MSELPHAAQFDVSLQQRCERLERQLQRERQIRLKSEAIAERGLREAYLANQRFELLCNVANAANHSTDPIDTLRFAIGEILQAYDWDFANVLLVEGGGDDPRLAGCGIWQARQPDRMFAFAELSGKLVAWPNPTIPGRLLIDPTAVWSDDLRAQYGDRRSAEAARCNLRASYSVPVLQGDALVAAMEFFVRSEVRPDPQLLETLTQIGVQIGRVFKRRSNEEKLLKNALHDPLTDLPNRALFEQRIETAFKRVDQHGHAALSVIYLDLDGFKLVNDAFGHLAGDQLLIAMTVRLAEVISWHNAAAEDETSGKATIARIGGDEFAILVEGLDHRIMAATIASEVHRCLAPAHAIGESQVHCAASLGIAHNDGSYSCAADLIRDADLAMYEAKASGTAQTVTFDQALRSTALARIALEAELRTALVERQFRLHYQPIVRIADNQVVGFEALVRWQRGEALELPDAFLPAIQDAGLMNVFGSWVLREACETAAAWRRDCPQAPPFHISVNVTPGQFLQPDFARQVQGILCAANLDPHALVIEVTEHTAIANRDLTARVTRELQAMGVRISLDDFGTGYSSFSHLQSLAFDAIKIDRSFVADENSELNWSIVAAVLNIAEVTRIQVIAEGIENSEQAARLAKDGCRLGQGYLYSHAVPAAAALDFLTARTAPLSSVN